MEQAIGCLDLKEKLKLDLLGFEGGTLGEGMMEVKLALMHDMVEGGTGFAVPVVWPKER